MLKNSAIMIKILEQDTKDMMDSMPEWYKRYINREERVLAKTMIAHK